MSIIDVKVFGVDGIVKRFYDAGAKVADAREYALASAAKMIRNFVKDFGRRMTPKKSPFSSTISRNKSGKLGKPGDINFEYQGARMEAFSFAKMMVGRHGAGVVKEYIKNYSGIRQRAVRRAVRIELRGYAKRSQFDEATGRYKKPVVFTEKAALLQPFAKLINFVRSSIDVRSGRATIGFFRETGDYEPEEFLESLVKKQAQGFSTRVTNRMRRFLFAIGFPFGGDALVIPARPWIQPAYTAIKDKAIARFNERFLSRVSGLLSQMGYQSTFGDLVDLEAA